MAMPLFFWEKAIYATVVNEDKQICKQDLEKKQKPNRTVALKTAIVVYIRDIYMYGSKKIHLPYKFFLFWT